MLTKRAALKVPSYKPSHPALRAQLLGMMKADQNARSTSLGGHEPTQQEMMQEHAVDAQNLPRIKAILKRYGFPSFRMVGRDGSNAAFLLVQHADNDPAFQTEALQLMLPLQAQNEIAGADVALLTDRALVAQNLPQRYGSQFKSDVGNPVMRLRKLEDPAQLDERRKSMDLFPMNTYACMMTTAYGHPLDLSALNAQPVTQ
jgi:hypothetical protein